MKLLFLFLSVVFEYFVLQYVNDQPMMAVLIISLFFGCQLFILIPRGKVKPYYPQYLSFLM